MTRQYEEYDVIIVGGGLAGLSAACELSGRALLLETDDRLGGKVCTENRNGIVCETGAIFAFEPRWFDFPVNAGFHYENDYPVGLFHRGRLHIGDSVADCLRSLNPEPRRQLCLPMFIASPNPQEAMIGEDLTLALKAFFRVIHPGTPAEAVPTRRRDCFVRHRADHFERGNGAMVEAMAANSGAEIRTGCRVYGLVPQWDSQGVMPLEWGLGRSPRFIRVLWRNESGAQEEAEAQKVILAVPATEARKLCGEFRNVSADFLGRVRYGGGIAVILHCRSENRRPLSYLVSTQGSFNTFIFYEVPGASDEVVVTGYIVGERATVCAGMDDAELTKLMIGELQSANIGEFTNCSLLGTRQWPEVAPIIEESTYRGFSASWLYPMPGVILAGDYTWWDGTMLPYGMWPAIASGRRAARICLKPDFFPVPISVDFGRMPLAETTVLRMGGNGPEFVETLRDGTVAYYGLLLQGANAGKDGFLLDEKECREAERYLLQEAVDDLWPYQRDYGVTSPDSALVMEGLLSAGRHGERLRESCRGLVDAFFDREEGGFRTLPSGRMGRAPYWRGVDCPATAFCAWLLTQIDPARYAEEITLCRDYLLRNQRVSGGWPGKWFPSQTIPIWYTLRFFASLEDLSRDFSLPKGVRERAVYRLQSGQGDDGSWGGSVIETSAALLALAAASPDSPSLGLGREWLRRVKGPDGWVGEPILAYWFEEKGERTLYFTRDLGRVSSAWATLALAGEKEKSV